MEAQPVVLGQCLEPLEVVDGRARAEVLLVGLGERAVVAARQPLALLLAVADGEQVGQVVAPAAGNPQDLLLDDVPLGLRRDGARTQRDQELHAGEPEFDDAVVTVDELAGPVRDDHIADAAARLGPEPVGREVDQHADEVAVEVRSGEDADLSLLGARHHQLGQPQQVGGGRLEQLVARQGAQRGQQLPAGVAVAAHARSQQDLGDPLAHHRHSPDRAFLAGGDQAEEDVDGLPGRPVRPGRRHDGHTVVVRGAAHSRHERRLEDDERRAAAERRQQFER